MTVALIAQHLARLADTTERDRALDANLRFFDEAERLIDSASILECLSAEFQVDGAHYIAYDGDFYLVNDDYVQRIDREIEQIPVSTVEFPTYRGETEPAYNTKVGKDHREDFICLDRALIEVPGETTFEACDLVAETGALVHVKRKGKSSTLSHLFLQAANSCEMLRRSAEARRQFNKLLAERARSPKLLTTVQSALGAAESRRDELEVVFAFLGDWRGRTISSLPLFSRISLVKRLAGSTTSATRSPSRRSRGKTRAPSYVPSPVHRNVSVEVIWLSPGARRAPSTCGRRNGGCVLVPQCVGR